MTSVPAAQRGALSAKRLEMTETETDQGVWDALRRVHEDGGAGRNVVDSGLISGLSIRDGVVSFALEIGAEEAAAKEPLRLACEVAVAAVPGVRRVRAALTAAAPRKPGPAQAPRPDPARTPAAPLEIAGVRAIVAVASGKGGVGKSTTAVNLTLALAAEGLDVGLLDADVYGPSVPRMLGLEGRKPDAEDRMLIPLEAFGIRAMSMGFLVPVDTPMVWRGPMVTGALNQLLRTVRWGKLDALVIDFPPGTGDAHLTLAQSVPLTGAVIVSTPQDVALIDARKGVAMFATVNVPVFGIVENMSYFLCPHCGERSEIFGHGGARAEAERTGAPFLGEIPLDVRIRETSDAGTPIVADDPGGPQAAAYRSIARKVGAAIGEELLAAAAPRISVK